MKIESGTQIGPYEIVGWLGAGAMGVVYRARDPRLAREVAIKLMPEALAADADRLQRFEREARAAGQLNHPNVLIVYDVGTHAGAPFIVSELLEGESLKSRLQGGALAPRKAIDYACQIAEGLAAAHAKNIVHRDLKPDNLFISSDGRVKILDFGIAKLTQPGDDATRHGGSVTETTPGIVIGTPGYMSPEQVRGDAIDSRSDLFSCGAILYEMLEGRAAFGRDTAAETMAAILREDPSATRADVPPALGRLVSRCLEKTREARFQSARDLAFAIDVLADTSQQGMGVAFTRPSWLRERVAWAVAMIALLMTAMLWTSQLRSPAPDSPTQFLSGVAPEGASLATEEAPAISPDGRQLAFIGYDPGGSQLLYIRALDAAPAARPMTNTDGASLPFWSPNSRSIGFFAQGKLKTLDVATGRIQTLADAAGARGGTWNQDDVILFVPRPADGPYRIPASGGEPTRVAMEGGPWPRGWFPSFLPDGRHF